MIAASTPAWLGFASGIFATVVGAVVAVRQTRLKSALEAKERLSTSSARSLEIGRASCRERV